MEDILTVPFKTFTKTYRTSLVAGNVHSTANVSWHALCIVKRKWPPFSKGRPSYPKKLTPGLARPQLCTPRRRRSSQNLLRFACLSSRFYR